ncbi:hypothetical protein E2C01_099677 [Portunus trituberculatus]|uniref:Uncharacterized protein n=1 Tax=Portunus trituberculatus TaxID=210409 RepID=A0A5B7KA85_PORTR|nr:hypothetical protein [Portunus trituberculatus]
MAEEGSLHVWPLRGQFRQYKHGSKLYTVQLDESGVTVTGDGEKQMVKVTDLVGCQCQQEQQQRGNSAYFTLLAYPLTGGRKRTRLALCFEVASGNTFSENLEVANAWRRAVYHAVRNHGRRVTWGVGLGRETRRENIERGGRQGVKEGWNESGKRRQERGRGRQID